MTKGVNLAGFTLVLLMFLSAERARAQTNSLPASGSVGIGTTEPASLFDVYGNASFGIPTFGGNAIGSVGKFQILTGGASPIADRLVFGTDNSGWRMAISKNLNGTVTDLMTVMDNGSVGIGTTNPMAMLDVGGSSNPVGGLVVAGNNLDPFYTQNLPSEFQGSGKLLIGWNRSGGGAETDFISSNVGNYSGGFNFYEYSNQGVLSQLMSILGTGRVGIGTPFPARKLHIAGDVQIDGNLYFGSNPQAQGSAYAGVPCGGDYAESVDVTGDRTKYEPGDVLVIDPDVSGKFLKSVEPYSTSVTGIYSTKPGTLGRRQTTPRSDAEVPMAMVGIVPVKVTAENGPIHRGDLLVTSSRIGYAMKGTDRTRMLGAVIGKALDNHESGSGVIEVVVTLQ